MMQLHSSDYKNPGQLAALGLHSGRMYLGV
jgi:hypothetical protein